MTRWWWTQSGLLSLFMCGSVFAAKRATCAVIANELLFPKVELEVKMPGLKFAHLTDPSHSTGATLFYFPKSARVAVDVRGGSVASSETTLFIPGSYSNEIDAIVFAGGSTMGLEAGDGVRKVIFKARSGRASDFDFIPSVPTAVVYDYGGRKHAGADPLVYPTRELGEELMKNLSDAFTLGRAGAGACTSCNKLGEPKWGGQGAGVVQKPWGRVFTASVVNAMGDVFDESGKSLTGQMPKALGLVGDKATGRQNTTLSIVVTDLPLDRNQLQRLAIEIHTSMARTIRPFHTPYDGDILFAVSLKNASTTKVTEEIEFDLAATAAELMQQSIRRAVEVSNGRP